MYNYVVLTQQAMQESNNRALCLSYFHDVFILAKCFVIYPLKILNSCSGYFL